MTFETRGEATEHAHSKTALQDNVGKNMGREANDSFRANPGVDLKGGKDTASAHLPSMEITGDKNGGQDSRLKTVADRDARPEDRLAAAKDLVKSGIDKIEMQNDKGEKYSLRLESHKAGARDMVSIHSAEGNGREKPLLKGVANVDGSMEKQKDSRGRFVEWHGSGKEMGASLADAAPRIHSRHASPEQSAAKVDQPAAKVEQPAAKAEQPAAKIDQPAAKVDQPAAKVEQPVKSDPRAESLTGPATRALDKVADQPTQKIADQPVDPTIVKPIDTTKVTETKPTETKPTETKPADTKATETKPAQTTADTKPADSKPTQTSDETADAHKIMDAAAAKAKHSVGKLVNTEDGLYMKAKFDVDADGHPLAKKIDPANGQLRTSFQYAEKGGSVDADKVPYMVLPGGHYKQHGVNVGDMALVRNKENGKVAVAVFGDVGPRHKRGEGSMALARELGLNPSPTHGGTQAKNIEYLAIPNSGGAKPRNQEELLAKIRSEKARLGVK